MPNPAPSRSVRFAELLAEGAAVPVEGWDFSWFAGRASEERPSWGYSRTIASRMAGAGAVLDVQTGGGEVFAEAIARTARPPGTLAATESWPPNLEVATRRLAPLGATVTAAPDDGDLPFPAGSFDLVISRHPTTTRWSEIARVLRPGGTYLSQQVGPGSNRELTEALMGPAPISDVRDPRRAAEGARAAGLTVVDLRQQALRTVFTDIAAVVVFLRKVVWTVPDFTVERYRDRLAEVHDRIETEGSFVAYAQRFLIEDAFPRDQAGAGEVEMGDSAPLVPQLPQ